MNKTIQWEKLQEEGFDATGGVYRARIFGGWLIFAENGTGEGAGLTFVPDPEDAWR